MSEPKTESDNQISNVELSDADLDQVTGGSIKGAIEGKCTKDDGPSGGQGGQSDPVQMFQQILQQLTQGPG